MRAWEINESNTKNVCTKEVKLRFQIKCMDSSQIGILQMVLNCVDELLYINFVSVGLPQEIIAYFICNCCRGDDML